MTCQSVMCIEIGWKKMNLGVQKLKKTFNLGHKESISRKRRMILKGRKDGNLCSAVLL